MINDCNQYVEDPSVTCDFGEPKGQCGNCGDKWYNHRLETLPYDERESAAEHQGLQYAHRIYLAGPDVFLPDPVAAGEHKKALCALHGFEGVYPLDNVIDGSLPKYRLAMAIGAANEALIRTCDVIIANLTPFRGPSADPGTVFEIGFGRALGMLLFGYTNIDALYRERVRSFDRFCHHEGNFLRDSEGMQVEDSEMFDNLMIEQAVLDSGGQVIREDALGDYENLIAFERCLMQLRVVLSTRKKVPHG
jgi:nucleoside 2-deoxyribosyltransferase